MCLGYVTMDIANHVSEHYTNQGLVIKNPCVSKPPPGRGPLSPGLVSCMGCCFTAQWWNGMCITTNDFFGEVTDYQIVGRRHLADLYGLKHNGGEGFCAMAFCAPCLLQQEVLEIKYRKELAAASAVSGAAK